MKISHCFRSILSYGLAALAAGACLVASSSQVAHANSSDRHGKSVAMSQPKTEVREVREREIRARELMVERDGLKLKLYEKYRVGYEETWKTSGKVVLLIHGGTWASRCTFDPDADHGYSMMEMLADAGYDTFALDLHGYGRSERSDADWTDSVTASRDIEAAVEFIRALRWVERVHLFGYQWGSQSAALFAINKPNKVSRLTLFGLRWKAFDRATTAPTIAMSTLGQQASLLKPEDGDLDPEFVRRRAQICRAESQVVPNGARRDVTRPSPVDPSRIKVPTLIIQGERDGNPETFADRVHFFQELGTTAKWYAYLPGLGKYAPIERNHVRFDQALLSFLDQQ